jgi:hypothetical protein
LAGANPGSALAQQTPGICATVAGERPPVIPVENVRGLMRANLGDRLMFGSDAAGPGAVGPSLEGIILCENAARCFRLRARPR